MKKFLKILIPCLALCLLACVLFLSADTVPGWEDLGFLPASYERRIQREILRAAEAFDGADNDAIEDRLAEMGFAVLDTDAVYPACLRNSEGLYTFWGSVSAGEDAACSVIRVSEDGGFQHMFFFREKGEDLYFASDIGWDENREPYARECSVLPIYEMELVDWGIFYYRLYPANDPHYVDYNQIRLTPVNTEGYDLNRKYILPVGYQMVNIFLQDWTEGDWKNLSFNDLFEYFYLLEQGEIVDLNQFSYRFDPTRAMIPAELFEAAICPYFHISLEDFRKLCQYEDETSTYPWRPIFGDDITTWKYPMCEPEVTAWAENADGTLTMTVQVYSPELKTDRLFIHELTVRPLEEGRFQYVSNKVTYVSDQGLPPNMARFALDQNSGT